jgi:hypothetical protein
MTKTEQIAAAISAKLTAAGLRVRLDTEALYSFEDLPAIVVDIGPESPRPLFNAGYVNWDLSISLFIGAAGAAPKVAAETTRLTAHTALYADRQLGGLIIDITASTVNRQIDADNPALGITEAIYLIHYRALEGQL